MTGEQPQYGKARIQAIADILVHAILRQRNGKNRDVSRADGEIPLDFSAKSSAPRAGKKTKRFNNDRHGLATNYEFIA